MNRNWSAFFSALVLLLAVNCLTAQHTSLELGRALNTNGDKRLTTFSFSQQIKKIQLSAKLMIGSGNFVIQPSDKARYPYIDQDGSYIFEGVGFKPGNNPYGPRYQNL